jgi:hypothetical protein
MSELAPSNETVQRRALRLSLGVALVFVITQLLAWPLANIAPFMIGTLLQDSGPLPLRRGWFIFKIAALSTISGFFIAVFLDSFPLLMVLVASALLYGLYKFILQSGDHILLIVAAVIGVVLMPYLVVIKAEAGAIVGLYLMLDFAVAMIGAWITWYLMPLSAAPPEGHSGKPIPDDTASTMALNITLVIAPLLAAFLAFGWGTILILVYSVIFAASYSSKAGFETGLKMIIANGVYGGVGMLVVYELNVMVPTLPFMITAIALAVYIFGLRIFGAGPTSPYWTSGLNGFLIMLGAALLSDQGFSLGTMADRVWQIVMATAYVSFVLAVLAMFQKMFQNKFPRAATLEE